MIRKARTRIHTIDCTEEPNYGKGADRADEAIENKEIKIAIRKAEVYDARQ